MSYDEFGEPAPQPRSRSWLVILLFVGGGLCVLVCCGGLAALGVFGMNVVARQVQNDLRENPVMDEHIGNVESFEIDWIASFAEPDDDTFVYQVHGSKGSGELTAKSLTIDEDTEVVVEATLKMPNGDEHDLFPEGEVAEE